MRLSLNIFATVTYRINSVLEICLHEGDLGQLVILLII